MLIFPSFFNAAAGGYEIEQSLRFDATTGTGLTRTPSSNGNGQTFTWSAWIKKGKSNHNTSGADGLLGAGTNSFTLNFQPNNDSLYFVQNSGARPQEQSVSKFRDSSAWMHIIFVADTTNATAADRTRVYINGERFTNWNAPNTNHANLNQTLQVNQTSEQQIGCHRDNNGITYEFYGYMAEVVMLDGTAVTDGSSFGEYDDNGVWRPIAISGLTFGTNGYYLRFDPTATNGIGHDHSGNGNNWTPTGFDTTNSTASTYDVFSDTPTTNWCSLNPLTSSSAFTLTNGNLDVSDSGAASPVLMGTVGVNSGKWYWEVTLGTNVGAYTGAAQVTSTGSVAYLGAATGQFIYNTNSVSSSWIDGSEYNYSTASAAAAGDVIGVALDFDSNEITFYKNGVSQGVFGSNVLGTSTWTPAFKSNVSTSATFNFGQRAFAYTPPTGFKALNTSNLPAPTVKDGSEYFDTKLYTGSGGSQSLTGLGFQPELVWIKARSTASSHGLYDAVRGVGKVLLSNSTSAEQNYGSYGVTSFDAAGFSVNDLPGYGVNQSGVTYAAWAWDAGGTGSSNTDGSITSTVSANPTAGFSIVSYTGTGSGATVGHGLGVPLDMYITKNRDATVGWGVYHKDLGGNTKYLNLNATASVYTNANIWNSTSPTSTVFSVGADGTSNGTGEDMIAYCFAEVEGYSKFGSYTGNGSTDGPFVYTGFRPRFLLYKRTDSATPWYVLDTARDPYNVSYKLLSPDSAGAEDTGSSPVVDLLSNGFKPRNTYATLNASGGTYIYMALAEHPFGGDGVSPATAR